jgi:predicted nucleotidyltransferase
MVEYTRPATWTDVVAVAQYFADAGVEYALIGGYAIAAHGFNRFSEDIDVLVNPSRENTARWVAALANLPDAATGELLGQDDIFEREGHYAIRVNDEFTIDVMPVACGHSWDELHSKIEEIEIEGTPVKVLSLEGLLLTKEGMRDKDRADARVLRQALARIRGAEG